jgi:hypothetical protein
MSEMNLGELSEDERNLFLKLRNKFREGDC